MSIDTAGYWCGEGDGHRCGYCQNQVTSISTGLYLSFISPLRYNALIDRGWRRAGMYMYKPSMEITCCPQYTIKCNALMFRISRSQRKVLKNFIEYLENSEPGSLPSKSKVRQPDVVHVSNQERHLSKSHNEKQDIKLDSCNFKNGETGPSDHSCKSKNLNSSSCSAETTPESRTYKTGAQLASSSKKRDFRRLRKLKKIAAAKEVPWEDLDVRELGTQPAPPTLSDRLSQALSNKRLELKLVQIDKENPESTFNKTFTDCYNVYRKYQVAIHKDPPEECRETSFKRFLCSPPFEGSQDEGGFLHQYWLDGKLVAVGVLDLLPWCISSVYFFYDPDYSALTFGTLSALFEIQLTQQMHEKNPDVKWYYMGYYIHTCPKMRYKSQFRPSFLLCPHKHTWWPVEHCQPQLNQSKFVVFDTEAPEEPAPTEEQFGSLKVLFNQQLCLYSMYKVISQEDCYEDILPDFVKLTGLENAQNICIYN